MPTKKPIKPKKRHVGNIDGKKVYVETRGIIQCYSIEGCKDREEHDRLLEMYLESRFS